MRFLLLLLALLCAEVSGQTLAHPPNPDPKHNWTLTASDCLLRTGVMSHTDTLERKDAKGNVIEKFDIFFADEVRYEVVHSLQGGDPKTAYVFGEDKKWRRYELRFGTWNDEFQSAMRKVIKQRLKPVDVSDFLEWSFCVPPR